MNHRSISSIVLSHLFRQNLCLNGRLWAVLDVELAKLDFPLYHSQNCLELVHGLSDELVRHYQDRVRLKVRSQLARIYYQHKCNLFDTGILGLCSLESLTNIVKCELFFVLFSNQGCAHGYV